MHLPLRRVDIDFSGVPFQWNPERPALSTAANAVSWAAVVFERRLCDAFREAMPDITDPALVSEAENFIAQEATHSRVHRSHIKALVGMHPALDGLVAELDALAEARLRDLPLLDRLAFGATVEGALAPLGRYLVAEREKLFRGSDARVSALFLWHFSEEIEHRSTALKLYRHMGGTWRGRIRAAWDTRKLQRDGAGLIRERFRTAFPDAGYGFPELPVGLPLLRLAWGLFKSLAPGHDTGGRAMPIWARQYLHTIRLGVGPVEAWLGSTEMERSRVIGARAA